MSAAQVVPFPTPNTPAYSEDAEQAVLAAMLMDADAIDCARQILRADAFYAERHKRIYRAMLEVRDAGDALDPLTLSNKLGDRGDLEAAGGKDYIAYLIDAVPTAANVEYHAGIVRTKYEAREGAAQFTTAAEMVQKGRDLVLVRRQLDGALDVIAPTEPSASALRLYDDVAIVELRDAVPIVHSTVYEDSIAVVIGKYGTLKTFLLLDIAFCIGTGKDWHGRKVRQGNVVYIYAEGRAGIKRRVAAWKEANGHSGPANVYFLPTSVRLTEPSEVARLLRLIERTAKGPVVAVFVDTIARNMAGDESKVEDMNRFVAGCDRIREATGATIIAAHHMGWAAERSRGSTALPGAINTELLVDRDDLVLTVKCTKQKDGIEEDANITLEAFPIAGSLALKAVGPNRAELTRNERTALRLVQEGDGLTATEWQEASDLSRSSFFSAKKRLTALVYVKSAKRRFVATDAGKLALSPKSNAGPTQVQVHRSSEVQRAHTPIGVSVGPDPEGGL